jgi:hypothetical protein
MSKLGALRHTATWFPLPLYDIPSMVCLQRVTVIVKVTVRDGYRKITVARTIEMVSNTVTLTIIYCFTFFKF